MRQRSESPASPPIFQRTGSGRYTTNNGYFGQNPLTYPQQSTYPSPPSNLDSLESYDSGLGIIIYYTIQIFISFLFLNGRKRGKGLNIHSFFKEYTPLGWGANNIIFSKTRSQN